MAKVTKLELEGMWERSQMTVRTLRNTLNEKNVKIHTLEARITDFIYEVRILNELAEARRRIISLLETER